VGADGKFVRADFAYDVERDLYICPGGKKLKTSGTVFDGTTLKYIAKRSDCGRCPLKPKCTAGRERRVQRDVNQEARDYVGEVKHVLGLTRLRLRGLTGARDEFLLAATVQNLKRLIKHAGPAPPMPMAA
jgi:hypothetical protein